MKLIKKKLFGGENLNINVNPFQQIQTFLSIIIIGYFGIKIIYGLFFNFYPSKYYFRNIDVTSNEDGTKVTDSITLNAYIPGMWNNEICDFITLIVLCYIVFIFSNVSSKSFIDLNGNLSFSFIFGYILGLGYPPILVNYLNLFKNKKYTEFLKYVYLILSTSLVIFIIIMNYSSAENNNVSSKMSYLIYLLVIVLIFFGLIFSKKNIDSYSTATYSYNDGNKCAFKKKGIMQTSGDQVKITFPFLVFIILLLFCYEPKELSTKNLYSFVYGILLGILVSSISYFGIEYFLQKLPVKECSDLSECSFKKIEIDNKYLETNEEEYINTLQDGIPTISGLKLVNGNSFFSNKYNIIKFIILIIILLIAVYLIYYFIKK